VERTRIPATFVVRIGCVNCVRGVGAARGVLYRRVGPDGFVLAAIAPEAQVDHQRFERAVAQAVARLGELEQEG